MARVNPRNLDGVERKEYLDLLWTSIAGLKTREEVKSFFKDLLSEGEAIMLARRIRIAQSLLEGEIYDDIMKEFKAGKATVSKVHQWLISGFGGYEKTIKKFEKELERRAGIIKKKQKQMEPFSFEWLKKKYPLHFLLFNLLDRVK
ncbi:MAG: YerC/YecD family TrpR-related protein [Patescibacteria group bacterium]